MEAPPEGRAGSASAASSFSSAKLAAPSVPAVGHTLNRNNHSDCFEEKKQDEDL